MTQVCDGNGFCLIQTETTNGYSKSDTYSCKFNCQPIKCPNYIICNTINPKCILLCHHNLCTNCDVSFGTWQGCNDVLNVIDDHECPVCLETKTCVSHPKCNHNICIDCFKKCYFPWETYELENKQPQFPYPDDILEEYDNNPNDEKWNIDYPLIHQYDSDLNIWLDIWLNHTSSKQYLAKCCLCRK